LGLIIAYPLSNEIVLLNSFDHSPQSDTFELVLALQNGKRRLKSSFLLGTKHHATAFQEGRILDQGVALHVDGTVAMENRASAINEIH